MSALPPHTDIVVVGNGPAGILISLLLSGHEPFYHAEPSQPHPDPILHGMLAPTALQGTRPRSLLKQDFMQLTNHIQHQLAEAGRDANPISAMFDTLAHPLLDTHRGEYPSFLEWRHSSLPLPQHMTALPRATSLPLSPPQPHPVDSFSDEGSIRVDVRNTVAGDDVPVVTEPLGQIKQSTTSATSTVRPHVVLGRGKIGGIWADMDQDHNQTLSYYEHMELPLYPFSEFVRDHAEHAQALDRPLRSTVSAYYKAYVEKVGIAENFSNFTTVTAVYHLKDLDRHCCCALDPLWDPVSAPKHPFAQQTGACRECSSYRYAVLGHIERHPTLPKNGRPAHSHRKRTKFLIRCKTLVLATGTFDQPKKLQAVSPHPCTPPCVPTAIQQTFHDTKQLEEWMKRHDQPPSVLPSRFLSNDGEVLNPTVVSPPPSPLPAADASPRMPRAMGSGMSLASSSSTPSSTLPIVIVGTGLSAADAILLIQEKQPWRRVLHIYRHFTASEPSPLKRCHRDVYPEYASIWQKMRKSASLRKAIQPYQPYDISHSHATAATTVASSGSADTSSTPSVTKCDACITLQMDLKQLEEATISSAAAASALCAECSYRGLPDAAISSWNPLTGEISILLNHGVVVKDRVAAVGVFIGKEVHMAFLKGSLAQEMLSSDASSPTFGSAGYRAGILAAEAGSGRSGTNCSPDNTSGQVAGITKDHTGRTVDSNRVSNAGTGGIGSVGGVAGGVPPLVRRGSEPSHVQRLEMLDMVTPPCTPPRSPVLRPKQQLLWKKQTIQASASTVAAAAEGLLMKGNEPKHQQDATDVTLGMGEKVDIEDRNQSPDKKPSLLQEGPQSSDEIKMVDDGDQSSDSDSTVSEEEDKVEKYQVLTLLHPLVSDMYSFRIIPANATPISSSTLTTPFVSPVPTSGNPLVNSVDAMNSSLVAGASISQNQSKTMPVVSIPPTAYYAPTRAKRCTRLPRYPKRPFESESTSNQDRGDPQSSRCAATPAPTSGLLPVDDHDMDSEQVMDHGTHRALDSEKVVSSGPLPRSHTSSPEPKSSMFVTRALSSCISMPCSPLLGCRIVCPALASPPLLMLGASAPAVSTLDNSMPALPLSTSAPSRATMEAPSLSSFSPTLSSSASLSSSNSPSPTMSLISASSSTTSLALDASEISAGVLGLFESDMEEGKMLDECWCCEDCESGCKCLQTEIQSKANLEKSLQTSVPLPPLEPEPIPLVDQSIYAAGAITGSKFVRYVLGNGMAIVADILKNERANDVDVCC